MTSFFSKALLICVLLLPVAIHGSPSPSPSPSPSLPSSPSLCILCENGIQRPSRSVDDSSYGSITCLQQSVLMASNIPGDSAECDVHRDLFQDLCCCVSAPALKPEETIKVAPIATTNSTVGGGLRGRRRRRRRRPSEEEQGVFKPSPAPTIPQHATPPSLPTERPVTIPTTPTPDQSPSSSSSHTATPQVPTKERSSQPLPDVPAPPSHASSASSSSHRHRHFRAPPNHSTISKEAPANGTFHLRQRRLNPISNALYDFRVELEIAYQKIPSELGLFLLLTLILLVVACGSCCCSVPCFCIYESRLHAAEEHAKWSEYNDKEKNALDCTTSPKKGIFPAEDPGPMAAATSMNSHDSLSTATMVEV